MKKYYVFLVVFSLALLCTASFSFTGKKGGDVFEIYLNGKQMLQQFVHADKSVKTLQLTSTNENDKIEVFYSHCGVMGKSRVLTIRNEKNELVKEIRFTDVAANRSLMGFYRKDIPASKTGRMNLYYSSKELPTAKLLATISWKENRSIARLQ